MSATPASQANNVLKPVDAPEVHYLKDYAAACQEFRWEDIH